MLKSPPDGMELHQTSHRVFVSNCLPGSYAHEAGIEVGDELLAPPTQPNANHYAYINERLKDIGNYLLKVFVNKHPTMDNGFPYKLAMYQVRTHLQNNISLNFLCPPPTSCLSAAERSQDVGSKETVSGRDVGNSQ